MDVLEWKHSYDIGDELIDADHRTIVGLINTLFDSQRMGSPIAVLTDVFDQLIAYTGKHFAREVEVMERYGYPHDRLLEQRSEHAMLTEHLRGLRSRFDLGDPPDAVENDLREFLVTWFLGHILEEDMKFRDFLAAASK